MCKERQLNDLTNNQSKSMILGNLEEAIVETKRQYEAIDRALEVTFYLFLELKFLLTFCYITQTLNSIQTIVQQCPALANLQRDLEETNFQSATTLPIYQALLSASQHNTSTTSNGHHHTNNHHHNNRTCSDSPINNGGSAVNAGNDCNANAAAAAGVVGQSVNASGVVSSPTSNTTIDSAA